MSGRLGLQQQANPLHRRMRAVGAGVSIGCIAAGAIGLAVTYFGAAGIIGLAVLAGPGLIVAAHVLERRAHREQKEEK